MKQTCILIIGMHRSGTSALTGVLSKFDVYLGHHLMSKNKFNPKGYFENDFLCEINDQLLVEMDSSWDDIFYLEEKIKNACSFELLKSKIKKELSGHSLIAIKDPRISFLFPLYQRALKELDVEIKVVIAFRNPEEVAHSLMTRDGFSLEKGMLLWVHHFLFAEKFSRGFPRILVDFDQLIKEPRQVISLISEKLSIDFISKYDDFQTDIETFLDADLKHHNSAIDVTLAGMGGIVCEILKNKDLINGCLNLKKIDVLREAFLGYQQLFCHTNIVNVLPSVAKTKQELLQSNQLLKEKEQQVFSLQAKESTIQIQVNKYNDLSEVVLQQSKQISELLQSKQESLELKEKAIVLLQAQVAKNNDLGEVVLLQGKQISKLLQYEHLFCDQEKKVFSLRDSLDVKEGTIVALNLSILSQIEKYQVQADKYKDISEHFVVHLHGSKSWKITTPLRYLSRMLNREA